MRDINHYMKYRQVNRLLQMKIRRYIEYMHQEEKYGSQRGDKLADDLSKNLKNEMWSDIYSNIFNNLKVFQKQNFSERFKKQLCLRIQEHTYGYFTIL